METLDFFFRVGAGAGLAALLGLEREATGKPAGLRTHALVGLGASLFTVLSLEGFGNADQSRVAAQIVSGIGFIGAGAIFRSGPLIKGLTTAAGLWAAAALGMATGAGKLMWAAIATGLAVLVLLVLRWVDAFIGRRRVGATLEIVVEPAAAFIAVRDQFHTLEPQAELVLVAPEGDGTRVQFVVGRDRVELLRHAVATLSDVTTAEIV